MLLRPCQSCAGPDRRKSPPPLLKRRRARRRGAWALARAPSRSLCSRACSSSCGGSCRTCRRAGAGCSTAAAPEPLKSGGLDHGMPRAAGERWRAAPAGAAGAAQPGPRRQGLRRAQPAGRGRADRVRARRRPAAAGRPAGHGGHAQAGRGRAAGGRDAARGRRAHGHDAQPRRKQARGRALPTRNFPFYLPRSSHGGPQRLPAAVAGGWRSTPARCPRCARCWARATRSPSRWTCSRRCTASLRPTRPVRAGTLAGWPAQQRAHTPLTLGAAQATRAARSSPPAACTPWCGARPPPGAPRWLPGARGSAPGLTRRRAARRSACWPTCSSLRASRSAACGRASCCRCCSRSPTARAWCAWLHAILHAPGCARLTACLRHTRKMQAAE